MRWKSIDKFEWNIPKELEERFDSFKKFWEVEKYGEIDDVLDLVKFMNGDSSYNAGTKSDQVPSVNYFPFLDHPVVFQGNAPWKRILTCGDYVDLKSESKFAYEFACTYGLVKVKWPLTHWRNSNMILSVFTTAKYANFIKEARNTELVLQGSKNPVQTITITNGLPEKSEKTIPEVLKMRGTVYRESVDVVTSQDDKNFPFCYLLKQFDDHEVVVVADIFSGKKNVCKNPIGLPLENIKNVDYLEKILKGNFENE